MSNQVNNIETIEQIATFLTEYAAIRKVMATHDLNDAQALAESLDGGSVTEDQKMMLRIVEDKELSVDDLSDLVKGEMIKPDDYGLDASEIRTLFGMGEEYSVGDLKQAIDAISYEGIAMADLEDKLSLVSVCENNGVYYSSDLEDKLDRVDWADEVGSVMGEFGLDDESDLRARLESGGESDEVNRALRAAKALLTATENLPETELRDALRELD